MKAKKVGTNFALEHKKKFFEKYYLFPNLAVGGSGHPTVSLGKEEEEEEEEEANLNLIFVLGLLSRPWLANTHGLQSLSLRKTKQH